MANLSRVDEPDFDRAELGAARKTGNGVVAERRAESPGERRLVDCLLRRDVDVLSASGALSFVMGDERGARRLCPRVEVGLRHAHAHRRAVVVALQHQIATGGLDD